MLHTAVNSREEGQDPTCGRTKKSPVDEQPGIPYAHGAEYGIRTRDPHLGKVVLYQLSQLRVSKKVL